MPTIDLVPPDQELSQVPLVKSNFLIVRTEMVNRMINDVHPVVECGIRYSHELIWLRSSTCVLGKRAKWTIDASDWYWDRKEKPARLQAAVDLMARWLQYSNGGVWGVT
jgi:hypothetical protein